MSLGELVVVGLIIGAFFVVVLLMVSLWVEKRR